MIYMYLLHYYYFYLFPLSLLYTGSLGLFFFFLWHFGMQPE